MYTRLNISSIAGVKGNIHEFFSLIQQNLDAFGRNPENLEHIHACRTYIHQLNGLFEMLELKDIHVVNGKTEQLIVALIEQRMNPDDTIINTIRQSTEITHDYLNDLIDGAEENLLRLLPAYRDLMLLLGYEQISAYDLFQPALVASPPLRPALANLTSQQHETLIRQARTEYQSGLLQWLKNTSDQGGLDKMRRAIIQIEKLPGTTEQRTFWWIAGGFLESLARQQWNTDPLNRKLCGKVEKMLRHAAEELPHGTVQLTRELLYQIARQPMADEKNRQIADICKAYALPSLMQFDESDLPTPVSPRDYLQEIQKTLSRIIENWQSFCSGEQAALDAFVNAMAQLDEPVLQTQSKPLHKLITAISGTAQTLQARQTTSAAMRDGVTMEIATALLHLESIVINFNKRQDNLAALVDTIAHRLNTITATDQAPEDSQNAPAIPTFCAIEYPAQNIAIQSQVATEMLVNLRQIEHTLAHFFQTPTDRAALSALTPLFNQISGVLIMLGMESANHLLTLCHNLTQTFADPDYSLSQSEQNLLVDGVGSLNFFLEALKHDTPDCQRIIDQAIAVFESPRKQTDGHFLSQTEATGITDIALPDAATNDSLAIAPESEDAAAAVVRIDSTPDAELLDIFLAESDEILAEIAQATQRCQADTTDTTSLTSIRRGFHTLKGSSRMIKLEFFSDAAWMMEQALNQWLNEKNQATAALIHLLEYAHRTFTLWCGNLNSTAQTEINTENLREFINALYTADDSEELSPALCDEDALKAADKTVTIGDISIEADLFGIFVKESRQHIRTLEKALEALLEAHPAIINNSCMLAAHTLASTSAALRLTFIAAPCSALEEWLSRLQENQAQLKEPDTQLIQNCVQQLNELLQKIYLQQFPDEIDLQLSQFLVLEIKKRLSEKEASAPEQMTHVQKPIDLSKYRLKKTPAYIQSAQSDVPEHSENNFTADSTSASISSELLHVFLEEARDSMPKISEKIRAWRILPQNDEIRINLLRLLHTLKGSANMIGAEQLGELIHAMESEVEEAFSEPVVSTHAIDSLEYAFDQLCEKIEQLQHTAFSVESPQAIANAAENASSTEIPGTIKKEAIDEAATGSAVLISGSDGTTSQESIAQPGAAVRVNTVLIDRLVNDSGEISIIRARIEAQLNNFKQSLQDLNESIERLHGQLREIEIQAETQMQSQIAQQQNHDQSFDPLELDRFTRFQELTRLMAESVDDVMTVQKNLASAHNAAAEGVSQQAVITRQLQQELVRIRMIPFGSNAERYYRIARKTAGELEKKINLTIQGEDIEIDRSILEKVSVSLEHILRNAIVHGIEKPDRRIKSGKPEAGQIAINLQRESNEVVISVRDDGIGLDLKKIRKKAIKLGLIHRNERLDDNQIAALIFLPGLTTRAQITGTAGRGMGMDIVHNDISGLGGQIAIDSQKNKGTAFHIRLPLTLAVAQTLMVSAGNQIFAIPSQNIAHIHELDWEALQAAYQNHRIDFDGHAYSFTHLSFLLNQNNLRFEPKKRNPVLLLQSSNLYLAVQVDALMDNQEVVVKNTGPQISQAPGIEGATLSGEGLPVLILNPLKLLQRTDVQKVLTMPFAALMEQSARKEDASTVVLVVDDSLTVRKATSRLLEREGLCVLTAKNGLEATEIMAHNKPDIVLADLEMPKMNGFELIEKIRQNPDAAHVPIIVISSRTAEKHREMARQLGANFFIGKPYKEDELLEHIHYYLQLQPGHASLTSRA
ncbi:MAG: Hpt domain-containing protein [Nitrosomonas sp.]|nr:Hpt domain-containing protein [Nitrosomonas sp.]